MEGNTYAQTGFVVAGGGFLSYWNHQLIKFEEKKIFGLKKQFCNNEKWEINTFSLQDIPLPFFVNLSPNAIQNTRKNLKLPKQIQVYLYIFRQIYLAIFKVSKSTNFKRTIFWVTYLKAVSKMLVHLTVKKFYVICAQKMSYN